MLYRIEYSCSEVDENQSLLWMHVKVINNGGKTQQAHVRAKINFQLENDLYDYHYTPYNWDASKWLPYYKVKLKNNSIVRDNQIIGKVVPESMKVNWEAESHFNDETSITGLVLTINTFHSKDAFERCFRMSFMHREN